MTPPGQDRVLSVRMSTLLICSSHCVSNLPGKHLEFRAAVCKAWEIGTPLLRGKGQQRFLSSKRSPACVAILAQ